MYYIHELCKIFKLEKKKAVEGETEQGVTKVSSSHGPSHDHLIIMISHLITG